MSNETQNSVSLRYVFIVTCYQNIVGVYSNQNDASSRQLDLINENRPADVVCRSIIYPQNS